MTKGPTPRHSKPSKPVTIDLDATDVTPKEKPETAAHGADPTAAKTAETDSREKAANPSIKPGSGAKPTASTSGKEKSARTSTTSPTGPKTGAGAAKPDPAKSEPAKAEAVKTGSSKSDPAKSGSAATGAPGSSAAAGGASFGRTGAAAATKASPSTAPAASSIPSSVADSKGKRGGGLGMVASGMIGAVLALGGGYALQAGGVLPAPGAISGTAGETEQDQAVAARIDELAAQLEGLSAESSAQPTGDGAAAELMSRIEALEAASSSEGASGSDAGQVEALTGRIDELKTRLNVVADSAATTQTGTDPALSATVAELQASQAGVTDALSQSRSEAEALTNQIATLDQAQTELAARLDARMETLEARLDEPAQQVDLARAIAAAGLKTAIDRGGSFMSELEAFASVVPDDPAVPELRDLAARGVPSRSELIEGFPEAANIAIAAEAPADPDASLVDRLMNSALSVVKVRQVGEIEGDTAEAIAARAEARLLDGDLEAALAEWNALPDASQAAAADFGDALAARARAEKLVAASLTRGGAAQAGPAESEAAQPESSVPEAAGDAASDASSEAPAN